MTSKVRRIIHDTFAFLLGSAYIVFGEIQEIPASFWIGVLICGLSMFTLVCVLLQDE